MIYSSVASRCTADPFVQIKSCFRLLKFFRVTSPLPCHNSCYESLKLCLPFQNVILTKGHIFSFIFPSSCIGPQAQSGQSMSGQGKRCCEEEKAAALVEVDTDPCGDGLLSLLPCVQKLPV